MRVLDYGRDWRFVNAAEVEADNDGQVPLRFARRFMDGMGEMTPIARMATSVELQLTGHLSQVEVDVRTRFSDGYGETGEWYWGPYKIVPGVRLGGTGETVKLALNVAGWRNVDTRYPLRLLFPTHCDVSVLAVRAAGDVLPVAQTTPFDYRALPGALGLRWLAHGDSITQGANCSVPTTTWVDLAARTLGLQATNLGIGGHGKAEPILADAIAARDDFDVLSLHVGANAGKETERFLQNLADMIRKIRHTHPDTPIFVASPILCLHKEGKVEAYITATRTAMDGLLDRLAATDPNLHPIRGLELIGDSNGLNIDFLHLCDFGFMRYAANAARLMRPFLTARTRPA